MATFLKIYRQHRVAFKWVKGHATNPFNNRCDSLATTAALGQNLLVDFAYESELKQ
jgi:ribonuclease HI